MKMYGGAALQASKWTGNIVVFLMEKNKSAVANICSFTPFLSVQMEQPLITPYYDAKWCIHQENGKDYFSLSGSNM